MAKEEQKVQSRAVFKYKSNLGLVNKAPSTRPKSPVISPELKTAQPKTAISKPEALGVKQLFSPQNSKPLTYLQQQLQSRSTEKIQR